MLIQKLLIRLNPAAYAPIDDRHTIGSEAIVTELPKHGTNLICGLELVFDETNEHGPLVENLKYSIVRDGTVLEKHRDYTSAKQAYQDAMWHGEGEPGEGEPDDVEKIADEM